jgi:ketosteroid isomerase-like protein
MKTTIIEWMITREKAEEFAREWVDAWNSHDLGRILSHYSDDFEMSSPRIALVMNEPSGRLKGKEKVGAYWAKALASSSLRFDLRGVLVGADSVVVCYRNVTRGQLAAEVFVFGPEGLVVKSMAHYD